jgi:hypothetical protein
MTTRRRPLRAPATILAPLAAAALLAACGGDSGSADDGIASLGTTTTSPAYATTTAPAAAADAPDRASSGSAPSGERGTTGDSIEAPLSTDPEEAALAYVECMRDHGIDMPDPEPGGGIVFSQTEDDGEGGAGPGDEEFQEAQEDCQPIMDAARSEVELDPEQEAEMREQMLEYAQCMRDHGIDMPDPVFGDNGTVQMQVGSPDEEGGPPPDDEAFEEANEACGQEGTGIAIGAAPAPESDD